MRDSRPSYLLKLVRLLRSFTRRTKVTMRKISEVDEWEDSD